MLTQRETLSGAGTIHRGKSIAVQARHFGPNLFLEIEKLDQGKEALIYHSSLRRLSISHNVGDRCGQGDQFTFY